MDTFKVYVLKTSEGLTLHSKSSNSIVQYIKEEIEGLEGNAHDLSYRYSIRAKWMTQEEIDKLPDYNP